MSNSDKELKSNRYEIISKLGEGGMGVVYKVADRLTGKLLALKEVKSDASELSFSTKGTVGDDVVALANEFMILGSLRHPNIMSVLDYGFDEEHRPFFTMDYYENIHTIEDYTRGKSLDEKTHVIMQLLQAVAYLHQRNIIHRDLKPSNILVTDDGIVKVLDFGLALSAQSFIPSTSSGTLAYMAPEVLTGDGASVKSDLFALGIIMYEIYCEKYPFDMTTVMALITQIINDIPDMSDVPAETLPIVARLIEKDADLRYASVDEVIAALRKTTQYPHPIETLAIRESYLQAASFTGREQEITQIWELARQTVTDNKGRFILVGGESGIGKSRLVAEFRVQAMIEPIRVIRSYGVNGARALYNIWREIVQWLAVTTPLEDWEASALQLIAPNIEHIIRRKVDKPEELPGTAERERLDQVIINMLKRQTKPVILVFEDLQWINDESLNLLKRIARMLDDLNIVILGTYRSDEVPNLPQEFESATTILLEPFDNEKIAALSKSILGDRADEPQLLEFLKRETEGNVFFVVEVVRALAEEAGDLRSVASMKLPQEITAGGIIAVLRNRLNQLPDETKPLLELAALRARKIDYALLQELGVIDDIDQWLQTCANYAILRVDGDDWYFAHDKLREQLMRDVAEDKAKWQSLHQQNAKGLESLYADDPTMLPALAHHWTEADIPDKAIHYNHKAAQIIVRGGTGQAIEYIKVAESFDKRVGGIDNKTLAFRHSIIGLSEFTQGRTDEAITALEASLYYMGIAKSPSSTMGAVLGVLRQLTVQVRNRMFPQRFLGRDDSSWLEQKMVMGILSLPMLYGGKGDVAKSLYAVLLNLNTFEAFEISDNVHPIMGYAWMHYLLGIIPLHSVSRYYRSLVEQALNNVDQAEKISLFNQQAVRLMMTFYDLFNGQWETVIDGIQTGVEQLRQFGDLRSTELALFNLSLAYQFSGDIAKAREALETGLKQSIERDDPELIFILMSALASLDLRTTGIREDSLINLDVIRNEQLAEEQFGGQFESHQNNKAFYFAIQAAYYVQQTDFASALVAIEKCAPIKISTNDKNPSYHDLFDILAYACWKLYQDGDNAGILTQAAKNTVLDVMAKAVRGLRAYQATFVFSRPASERYNGLLLAYQGKQEKSLEELQKALTSAQSLKIPLEEALARYTLYLHDAPNKEAHRQTAQEVAANLGGIRMIEAELSASSSTDS